MNTTRFVRLLPSLALLGIGLATLPGFAQAPPAHERIAYVTLDYETRTTTLSMADPDGGNAVTLLTDGFFSFPAWSPDGRQLAFIGSVRPYDDPALWLMNSDGTGLHTVLPEGRTVPDPLCAVWSPDGTQFLFSADTGIGGYYFYVVNEDGSGMERHQFRGIPSGMEGVPGDLVWPCATWSPDGQQIAVLGRGDGYPPGQLYVSTLDGASAAPFPATTPAGTTYHQLVWSPDGERVVLYVLPGSGGNMETVPMAVASADGSVVEARIGGPPNLPGSAAWSPDSQQIVFVANEQGVESMPGGDLWVASAGGSNVHTLSIEANIANLGTSWGLIPGDIVLPTAPISFAEAAG